MRALIIAMMVAVPGIRQASAQRPDSTRADSAARARADSIRIVRELEAMTAPAAAQAPQVRTAGAYMNIGLSALTDFGWSTERNVRSLQRGDHDPRVRGFTIPNAEIALDGAVDPYFKGFGNIVYTQVVTGTSAPPAVSLAPDTAYFWRVTPANACGTGSEDDDAMVA